MNTCIINNNQTVSQDRLTYFTGTKNENNITLRFFLGLYQSERSHNSHIL